jgi:hypothetical protein
LITGVSILRPVSFIVFKISLRQTLPSSNLGPLVI